MRRILLDEGVPIGVRTLVTRFHVETVAETGWAGLSNGALIQTAEEAGLEVMITCDQNIRHQQNLAGRRPALVVLTTNHWDTIRTNSGGASPLALRPSRGAYRIAAQARRTFHM